MYTSKEVIRYYKIQGKGHNFNKNGKSNISVDNFKEISCVGCPRLAEFSNNLTPSVTVQHTTIPRVYEK